MHVGYLIGRYPTVSHTFIQREIQALREHGTEVTAFAIWPSPPDQLLAEADREEARRTRVLLPLRPLSVLRSLGALLRRPAGLRAAVREALALNDAVRRPRAWMLTVSWVLEAGMIVATCRREGIRHMHAHLGGTAPSVALLVAAIGSAADGPGTWTWSFTVHGPAEFYDIAREGLDRKIAAATFVVAISDFARGQLMSMSDETEWPKIAVVHCGLDPSVFAPSAPGTADGVLRILCVGRLTTIKGQAVLLDAVARLRGRGVAVELVLVGDGPKRAAYERIVAEHGLDEVVTLTGAVGQDKIREHFAACDVFCLSSFAEGVPVVLMEAMAMGKPVVASSIMGIAELVQDGVSGRLLPAGRADLLADALQALGEDADLRHRMGEAGRDTVMASFAITTEAAKLDALLAAYAAQP